MKSLAARAAILVMRRLTVLVNSCYDTKTNNHTMFVDTKGRNADIFPTSGEGSARVDENRLTINLLEFFKIGERVCSISFQERSCF